MSWLFLLEFSLRSRSTMPLTTNVYSTRSSTKGRNYCLLEKLYFATLAACRDNRLPNLKYITPRCQTVNENVFHAFSSDNSRRAEFSHSR